MSNVYFELTREFNARERIAALASGQAVVYHRLAMTSKDGDWILRESEAACGRVLDVLAERGATYRPGAPLDVRWLRHGWSSHFEFLDDSRRRVRCDFFSRPPRIAPAEIEALFREAEDPLLVIGVEALIRMKRTQRAKDYAVIGELARLLPPEREIEVTTDADRIVEMARARPVASTRPAVKAALAGLDGEAVELEVAREMRVQRLHDQRRVQRYMRAAAAYLAEVVRARVDEMPLVEAHAATVALAERWLPAAAPAED